MKTEYMECPYAKRAFNDIGQLITLACDRWNCPYCGRVLAWRWAQRVRFGINLAQPHDALFWTLTLPGWVIQSETGFRILRNRWDKIRQTIRRQQGGFTYAAFVECQTHRHNMAHFHLITFKWPYRRLKDLAVHCGFGFEADIEQVSSQRASWYVSKYASKQGMPMPKGFRRVRLSYDWPKLPDPGYDHQIIYPQPRESVKAYVRRVAVLLDEDYNSLMSTWLS